MNSPPQLMNSKRGLSSTLLPNGPDYIRSAYEIPEGSQGETQTIGLVEFDNFYDSDVAFYASYYGVTSSSINIERVYIESACEVCNVSESCNCGPAPPTTPGNGWIEVTLDIDMILAVAPRAKILVYISANYGIGFTLMSQIANDNLAKVVSSSWGEPEDYLSYEQILSEDQIFIQMALQGQTVFASSGDSGAFEDAAKHLVGIDPAIQPLVTGVGK